MVSANDGLPNPFGDLGRPISLPELRETAYEILIGACRSSAGSKPLTYVSQSERRNGGGGERAALTSQPSLQRSLTSAAASKVKAALGMKSSERRRAAAATAGRTVGEMLRVQMRVSEATDSRVRRALLRIAAGQLGRRIELVVLPLELLQQLKPSDFPTQQDFESFQKRNLKMLELGLLLHPRVPLDKSDPSAQQLKQLIRGSSEKPLETGKNNETMQVLRTVVMSLACRSPDACHWADGPPLNLRLYQTLLEACFDVDDESSIIDEVDEVLELSKKTWPVLGVDQATHNLCFLWVLFNRYVETGQIEDDLLFAASNLLAEVEKDAKATKEPEYSRVLSSVLSVMLGWAEKRLLTYHETFRSDDIELMESVASLAVTSAKILVEDIAHEYRRKRKGVDVSRERVETYIRSSIRTAFAQKMEKINLNKRSSKTQHRDPIPILSLLAQETTELALTERDTYSPVLKRWHPLPAGVAAAALHGCYGAELKQFAGRLKELTPDAVLVLIAADKLEKQLVQIAVEDAAESEDGGMAVIKEMPPYEAEAAIGRLVKEWIKTRVDRLKEWVDRNIQQEVWNAQANKEHVGPSVIEILRMMDETVEAFFLLPIPIQPALVTDLMAGLDRCLQQYTTKAVSGCGSRNTFIPSLPGLTRCSAGSKFFKKKDKPQPPVKRKPHQLGAPITDHDLFGVSELCVRMNTLQRIRSGADALEKKAVVYLKNSGTTEVDPGLKTKLELSMAAASEGIQQLCEAAGYRIIFRELAHVLWDGLYVGGVSSSRVDPFLQELERYLEVVATTVAHDRVRTRAVAEVMRASFDGFLLVILAGGPARAFAREEARVVEEDFQLLCDLFWSNGDGLPIELIESASGTVGAVLGLLKMDTEGLIGRFRELCGEGDGSSRLPLPPTTGRWGSSDANTVLRVLCHRDDEVAAKFLKKTYNLPKKL